MSKTIYKCPFCEAKYTAMEKSKQMKAKQALYKHMETNHKEELGGLSPAQCYFNHKYNKTHGTCVVCKVKETKWNEKTERYERFCSEECKQKYKEDFKKKMIKKYGKEYLTDDPEMQKKMLANRKISGTYTWSDGKTKTTYTGSYEKHFLEFLDLTLNFNPEDVIAPAPQVFTYVYEGKNHFYMPDFYITSLNILIEIKDGGENPNNHPKIQKVDKEKERLKDAVMAKQTEYKYMKIVNKDYSEFLAYINEVKSNENATLNEGSVAGIANISGRPIKHYNAKKSFLTGLNKVKFDNIDIYPDTEALLKEDETPNNSVTIDLSEKKEPLIPLYIVLSGTKTFNSEVIKKVTKSPFSHASISFDSSLKDMYSFNKPHVDMQLQFTGENIFDGIWKEIDSTYYSLYAIFLKSPQIKKAYQCLEEFKKNKDKMKYSYLGCINILFGKETHIPYSWFCSQFVAEIIRQGDPTYIKKDPSLYAPGDLKKLKNIRFISKGLAKNYNEYKTNEKVKKIMEEMNSPI